MSYAPLIMTDRSASWSPAGHVGKFLTAGGQRAIVVSNTRNQLTLAPWRPGASTA